MKQTFCLCALAVILCVGQYLACEDDPAQDGKPTNVWAPTSTHDTGRR